MILSDYKKEYRKKKLNLNDSVSYWKHILLSIIMRLFEWDGLPFEQKEIEVQLALGGFTGFLFDTKIGFFVNMGGMSGVTQYPDEFTTFVFSNPLASGIRKIDKDCVICNNNEIRFPSMFLIDRYALLLAHADLSLQAILINSRATGILSASNQAVADSVASFYKALENGNTLAIVDNNGMESLVNSEGLRQIATSYPSSNSIIDFYTIMRNLLKSFYSDLGIKSSNEKRERLITEEVEAEDESLLLNVDNMLASRQMACEKINRIFGLNVSVKLNKKEVASTQQKNDGGVNND